VSRPLGWKQDPYDDRDRDALKTRFITKAAPVAVIPSSSDNHDIVKIVDQGQLGSCTANSTGQIIRAAQILELRESGMSLAAAQNVLEFWSRLWAYFLARGFDHTTKEDAGTNIRTIFKAINKYGFCAESTWPYNDNTDPDKGPVTFDKMPSAEAFRESYDLRNDAENIKANVVDYARITEVGQARINAVKLALSQRHLIAFGTTVTEKFCSDGSANKGKPIDPPTANDALAGGHAMAMGSYDASGVGVINSWSKSYGLDGWCRFSWDYVVWAQTTDLWVVRRAPQMVKAGA
jgi:hypothetical protein